MKTDGEKNIVTSTEVKVPIAVRYAWKDDPKANLVNGVGLPGSPFRRPHGYREEGICR